MAIKQRGGSFEVSVSHKGKRFRKSVKTQAEAEKLEAQVKSDFLAGKDPTLRIGIERSHGVTLGDMFYKTKAQAWPDLKSKPRRNAELLLDRFDLWNVSPLDLTPERLWDMWEALRMGGNSEATINRKKAALSKMFTVAIELNWIEKKPHGLKQTKEKAGRIRYLTEPEESRLLELAPQLGYKELYYLLIFLIDTGARVSEALSLELDDVTDLGVYLDTKKNGNPRLVPLTKRARKAIGRWEGLTQNQVNNHWDRIREIMNRLDDPGFTPHICRHTCASRLVMGGFDLRKVKEWLGHKSITTTLRYAHLMPDALAGGVSILERQAS